MWLTGADLTSSRHSNQPFTEVCLGSTLGTERNSHVGGAPVSYAFEYLSPPSQVQDTSRTNHTPSRPHSPPSFPFFLFYFVLQTT